MQAIMQRFLYALQHELSGHNVDATHIGKASI